MYAIIETGGKQYKVKEGDSILVEKLEGKAGDSVNLNKVLLMVDEDNISIGTPYLDSTIVVGKIISQQKGEKIRVSKFKAKVRYRKTTGHRQLLTKLGIVSIGQAKIKKASVKPKKTAKAKK